MPFIDDFQEQIWKNKYQYKNETYEKFCERIAYNIFSTNKSKAEKLKSCIMDFRILFGGRINSNIGVEEKGLTLFNCFIESTVKNPDSLEGILDAASKYALTLKSEGGVGFCANYFRPEHTIIRKIGVTTPGAVKFLEIFDKISEVITSGSVSKEDSFQGIPTKNSIRKGATMVTLDVRHPDIENFITAKAQPNKLTKMNMSVLITNAFMSAVESNNKWELWFPDINFEKYDDKWDGDFDKWENKNYPKIIYKTIDAIYLWDLLLSSSFHRNEPGLLFIDTIRHMDNIKYLNSSILATNPSLRKGTKVLTTDGIKSIDELESKEFSVYNLNGKISDAKCFLSGKGKRLYKLNLSGGVSYYATAEHKWPTLTDIQDYIKKDTVELEVNDFIPANNFKKSLPFGNIGSYDDGFLVGWNLGDGSITKRKDGRLQYSFIFSKEDKDNGILAKVLKQLKIITDKEYIPSLRERDGSQGWYELHLSNKKLRDFFKSFGVSKKDIGLPSSIWNKASDAFRKGMLDGLFSSDGCVENNKNVRMIFTSAKKQLINDIADLLGFYGINGNLRKSSTSEVAFPNGKFYNKVYIRYDLSFNKSECLKFRKLITLTHNNKSKKLNGMENLIKSNFYTNHRKVLSIEKTDLFEDVWDISVFDDSHCFELGRCITGNCGEVVGNTGFITHKGKYYELGDVCNLGSLNLTKYYSMDTKKFNEALFKEDIIIMVEALDNIIDISEYPLPMYEQASKMKRKIGLGLSGVASLFFMIGIRYGSPESVSFIENILSIFMNTAYQASALLAKEKGVFELYDKRLLDDGYVKHSGVLTDKTISLIKKYGLRNSALTAIAPNGSLAILAGNVSGGLEPVFSPEYTRWNRVEGNNVDFKYPSIHKGEWFETDYLKKEIIADEVVLISKDGNYRVDKNQGLCRKHIIKDYGYNLALQYGLSEFTSATELSVEEHFNILEVYAKHIDLSCSKTINLPNDISFEDFKALYGKIHKHGIKGCTTYRQGTSVAVLETKKKENCKTIEAQQKEFLEAFKGHESGEIMRDVIHLPEEFPSKGVILRGNGSKWYVHFSFMDVEMKKPYACFISTNTISKTSITMDAINGLKKVSKKYKLDKDKLEEVEKKFARQSNHIKIGRMLGFLFRHNVPMIDIVKALGKVDNAGPGTLVFRLKKYLMNYVVDTEGDLGMVCPSCGSIDIIFQEGCMLCSACGSSLCS